jgi:Fic family protein
MPDHRTIRTYEGFPSFAEWAGTNATLSSWDLARSAMPPRDQSTDAQLQEAWRVVRRAAAVDTGALEALYKADRGFTLTVAMELAAWQAFVEEKVGKAGSLIQAQLDTYERILDLMNAQWPLTEAVIRELHSEVCKAQHTFTVQTAVGPQEQSLPKGEYKQHANNVLTMDGVLFEYCPPDRVVTEMHEFVQVLSSPEFAQAHPVLQASWSHYAFILIHPFADGNGRVARLLASVYFCKAASIPYLVFADEREEYFHALRKADSGDFQPFIEFSARCGGNAFNLVADSLRAAAAPDPEESIRRLKEAYNTRAGLTRDEFNKRTKGFVQALMTVLESKVKTHAASAPITIDKFIEYPRHPFPPSMEDSVAPVDIAGFAYHVLTTPPLKVLVTGTFQVEMQKGASPEGQVRVTWLPERGKVQDVFATRLEEILTPGNPRLGMQIDMALERCVREILATVVDRIDDLKKNS